MATTVLNISPIVSDPNVRNGRPIIAGTGICVADVVIAHSSGDQLSPEQIASSFRLSLSEVYAALSYYHSHRDEIDSEINAQSHEAAHLIEMLETQGKLLRLE